MKIKIILFMLISLLIGCSTKDEYGIKESDYQNIIHCETTLYEENYSSTIIEQLYANNGIIEYVYNEQFKIFENKEILENSKNEHSSPIDGITINVHVDKKNGAISTVTRIDYNILDYPKYLKSLTKEELDDEMIEENKKDVTDLSNVNMEYCRVIK